MSEETEEGSKMGGGGWGNEEKGRGNGCMGVQTVGGSEASRTWKKTEG